MTQPPSAHPDWIACPDAEFCKRCPCADDDDVCFPGERLRVERDLYRETLERIEGLQDRWSAPLEHPVGDMSDPAYAGAAAWAAVGSEAHKLAKDAIRA